MYFSKFLCYFFFVSTIIFSNAKAEEPVNIKLAIVDLMKIEENALVVKDIMQKYQAQENKLRNILEERKKNIEEKYRKIESEKATLSKELLEIKAKDLERDFINLQKDEKIYSEAMNISRMQALKIVQDDVRSSVAKVAHDQYTIVLSTSALLYVDIKAVSDITPDALDALNNKIKTIDFESIYNGVLKDIEQQSKTGKESHRSRRKK